MFLQIKPHAEITIKSGSFRQMLIRCLRRNLRTRLTLRMPDVRLQGAWDRIDVWCSQSSRQTPSINEWAALADEAARTPGVQEVNRVEEIGFDDFSDVRAVVLAQWQNHLAGKSFVVRVRRRGHHDFSSHDLERYLGAEILAAVPDCRVNLKEPEVRVDLAVQDSRLRIIAERWDGIGGYPTGSQGSALALFSGGYDSPVAAWRMMVRGLKTHFLYFSFGDAVQDTAVFSMARILWSRYGASHKVYFRIVPWVTVVNTLAELADEGLRGVLLKRAMLRFAEQEVTRHGIQSLIMGDAVGQVSSQSLHNMALTDRAVSALVLRPLVADDKARIIRQATQIGTAELAAGMTEYCGTVGRFPSGAADAEAVEAAEAGLPADLFDAPLRGMRQIRIDRAFQSVSPVGTVPEVSPDQLARADVRKWRVVDIRSPGESVTEPLALPGGHEAECIPHYRLWAMAGDLDPYCQYVLYCNQSMMSRIQAARLREEFGLQASVLATVDG